MSLSHAHHVGDRLRSIRLQKALSLHDVEEASSKEFKASVLGAYERGERSISVPRLQRLASFYGVPVEQLLPPTDNFMPFDGKLTSSDGGMRIDLARLRETRTPETDVLSRYVSMIQMARGDFNGRVLTVRQDDMRALAAVLEMTPDSLSQRLEDLGVRVSGVL